MMNYFHDSPNMSQFIPIHTHLNKECFQHHIGFACLPKAPPNWIRHSAVFPLCHCYLSNCYVDLEVPQLSTKGRTKRHISRRVYSHQTADLRQVSLESSLELLRSLLDTCATWVFNQNKGFKNNGEKMVAHWIQSNLYSISSQKGIINFWVYIIWRMEMTSTACWHVCTSLQNYASIPIPAVAGGWSLVVQSEHAIKNTQSFWITNNPLKKKTSKHQDIMTLDFKIQQHFRRTSWFLQVFPDLFTVFWPKSRQVHRILWRIRPRTWVPIVR